MTTALGIASGLGAYLPVALGAGLLLFVVVCGGMLEQYLHRWRPPP